MLSITILSLGTPYKKYFFRDIIHVYTEDYFVQQMNIAKSKSLIK